jgi:hypothetical protein
VTDREHQAEALVGHGAHRLGVLVLAAAERAQLGLYGRPALLAPQAVDRAVARGGQDPGRGVVRRAGPRPALQRDEKGVLNGLLGAIEVAEDAGEDGDRLPRLAPEQAVDDGVRFAQEAACSAVAPFPAGACSYSMSGRTSMAP